MTRAVWCLIVGALLPQLSQQREFRSTTNAVVVDVAVLDRGKPVRTLLPTDFELFDNGVRQSLTDVQLADLPFHLTMIVDVSPSVSEASYSRLADAADRMKRGLGADDKLTIFSVASAVRMIPSFAQGRPVLTGDDAHTSLIDALAVALMGGTQPGRREVIVCLTDGKDTNSFLHREMIDALIDRSTAGVSVIAVSDAVENWMNINHDASGPLNYFWVLRELTARSGGSFSFVGPSDSIVEIAERLLQTMRAQYSLRYTPEGVTTTGWHTVSVKVRGGHEVRSRRGYFAGSGR